VLVTEITAVYIVLENIMQFPVTELVNLAYWQTQIWHFFDSRAASFWQT